MPPLGIRRSGNSSQVSELGEAMRAQCQDEVLGTLFEKYGSLSLHGCSVLFSMRHCSVSVTLQQTDGLILESSFPA